MSKNGYVYIAINESLPGYLKIGKTARDSRARVKELSASTSIPTAFTLAFEVFSEDYELLEVNIHKKLSDFRVNLNREFFKYPLSEAIIILQQLNSSNKPNESSFEAIDITEKLKKKYPNCLRDDIVSVRIVQPESRVWLEITTESTSADGEMVDQTIKREDLGYIVDSPSLPGEDNPMFFRREDAVQVNAEKFVEKFDEYSISMTTYLFNEDHCKKISEEYWANRRSF